MSFDNQGNVYELLKRVENVGSHRAQGILGDGRPFSPAGLTLIFGA